MLKRKVRTVGSSQVLTLPSQLMQIHSIKDSDWMSYETINDGFIIRKIK